MCCNFAGMGGFGGWGLGARGRKQRVVLAFFVKTDIYEKKNVGIFVLNGGNIFF